MATPLTIIILPGSFMAPSTFQPVVDGLQKEGVEAFIVDYPSSSGPRDPLPPATMFDDAQEAQRLMEKCAEEGKELVVVSHSYGGIPATQSIEGCSKRSRNAQGKTGGVTKAVYLSALVPDIGQSCVDFMGSLPDFIKIGDEYMDLDPIGGGLRIYSDIPHEEATKLTKEMTRHSTPSFNDKLEYAGYQDVEEIHYIVLEEDLIIPPEVQYAVIDFMESQTGRNVNIHRIKSGHCPSQTQPESVVEILKQIAV